MLGLFNMLTMKHIRSYPDYTGDQVAHINTSGDNA